MEFTFNSDYAQDVSDDRRTYSFEPKKYKNALIKKVEMDDIYNFKCGFIRISADDGVNVVTEDIIMDFASVSNLNSKLSSVMLARVKFYEEDYLKLLMKTAVTATITCFGNYWSLLGYGKNYETNIETIDGYEKNIRFPFKHYLSSNYLRYTEIKFPIIRGIPTLTLTAQSGFINTDKTMKNEVLDETTMTVKDLNLPTIYITVEFS